MKRIASRLCLAVVILAGVCGLTGCESSGGGGTSGGASVSSSFYYGTGFYDPWYYGAYYPPDVIVTPPPLGERPPGAGAPRPEHPIATVPDGPSVSPRVSPSTGSASVGRSGTTAPRRAPSIPSAPRPMPRMGGRR